MLGGSIILISEHHMVVLHFIEHCHVECTVLTLIVCSLIVIVSQTTNPANDIGAHFAVIVVISRKWSYSMLLFMLKCVFHIKWC